MLQRLSCKVVAAFLQGFAVVPAVVQRAAAVMLQVPTHLL
jgi:hypothetical protein